MGQEGGREPLLAGAHMIRIGELERRGAAGETSSSLGNRTTPVALIKAKGEQPMNITLIGASDTFAGGFATWAAAAGHEITIVGPSRVQAEAFVEQLGAGLAAGPADRLRTEIVFAALPYVCLVDAWESYGDDLDGRVLVDVALPVDFAGTPVHLDAGSAAEALALARPRVRVVKAFHPGFVGAQGPGGGGAEERAVLLAGDDAGAKRLVAAVFDAGGMHAIDFGPLRRTRELDALGFKLLRASVDARHAQGGRV